LEAGFCFRLQVKKGKGQKPLLGLLVELTSDLDSYNIDVPRIKAADDDNYLWEITHRCIDGYPTHL
jgi:hypothetical protein